MPERKPRSGTIFLFFDFGFGNNAIFIENSQKIREDIEACGSLFKRSQSLVPLISGIAALKKESRMAPQEIKIYPHLLRCCSWNFQGIKKIADFKPGVFFRIGSVDHIFFDIGGKLTPDSPLFSFFVIRSPH